MGKYNFSSHHLDTRNELSYRAIANELAEANRLKRIELSWIYAVPNDWRSLKELEDKA